MPTRVIELNPLEELELALRDGCVWARRWCTDSKWIRTKAQSLKHAEQILGQAGTVAEALRILGDIPCQCP
jgi:hypothetical protein